RVHANERRSPSGSLDAEPSSSTSAPTATVRSAPASARGAEFHVSIVTESGELSTVPSLTTSVATYAPGTSIVKIGRTALSLDSVAALPDGATRVHEYVN